MAVLSCSTAEPPPSFSSVLPSSSVSSAAFTVLTPTSTEATFPERRSPGTGGCCSYFPVSLAAARFFMSLRREVIASRAGSVALPGEKKSIIRPSTYRVTHHLETSTELT